MSHTNSTTNYNLPQFIGTDKPTWLNDVNGAMSAIDTQMKANADSATSAGTSATTANNAIGTLSNLNTTTKTDLVSAVNEVNTNLGTVSGVASGASSTATQAKDTADGLASYLTLTQIGDAVLSLSGVSVGTNRLKYASNANGTFGKIYGDLLNVTTTNSAGGSITIATPFRPTATITINSAFIQQVMKNGAGSEIFKGDITIATDGTLTISRIAGTYNSTYNIIFPACCYFMADFGDQGE